MLQESIQKLRDIADGITKAKANKNKANILQ